MQPCTTSEELWGALQAARAEITPANLQNLFESMPRRLADCIVERGGATVGSEYFCPTCKQYNWPSHYLNTPTHIQSTISTSLNATKAVFPHAATVDT